MKMKSSSPANLTQVARRAKVSIATASRVLNGRDSVAAATKSRVVKAANEIGYIPDPRFRLMGRSRGANARRTGNVGLLIQAGRGTNFVTDPYYGRLFWSIEQELGRHDYHPILSTISDQDEAYLPRFLADASVDGVLVQGHFSAGLIGRIAGATPTVLVNAACDRADIPSLVPDERSGIRQAMDYLLELGHRRIRFFDIHDEELPRSFHHLARTAAFEQLKQENDLTQADSVVLTRREKPMTEVAADHLRRWADQGNLPTALLCAADVYALAFLEAAEKQGVRVPEQMSVIGVDDTAFCEYSRPKLTSIRQPLEAMGQAAVRLLLDKIKRRDETTDPVRVTQRFDVKLVKRGSCDVMRL